MGETLGVLQYLFQTRSSPTQRSVSDSSIPGVHNKGDGHLCPNVLINDASIQFRNATSCCPSRFCMSQSQEGVRNVRGDASAQTLLGRRDNVESREEARATNGWMHRKAGWIRPW